MQTNKTFMSGEQRRGFTLIELLTVIAIIGILAAIIIPTVGAVRVAANKATTKSTFSQWSVSMNLFKQEYGYYPSVGDDNKVDSDVFFPALTGKTHTGGIPSELEGNAKRLSFYSASEAEVTSIAKGDLTDGDMKDAFGNTDIVYYVDLNGDGMIKATGDNLAYTPVSAVDGTTLTPDSSNFSTSTGIRSGVIFYSAGKGASRSDIIGSW